MSGYDNDPRVRTNRYGEVEVADDANAVWTVCPLPPRNDRFSVMDPRGELLTDPATTGPLLYGSADDAIASLIGGTAMNEPANLTAWVDGQGDVWVRFDDVRARARGRFGGKNWHHLRGDRLWLIDSYRWDGFVLVAPFVKADAALTAMAVDRARQEVER